MREIATREVKEPKAEPIVLSADLVNLSYERRAREWSLWEPRLTDFAPYYPREALEQICRRDRLMFPEASGGWGVDSFIAGGIAEGLRQRNIRQLQIETFSPGPRQSRVGLELEYEMPAVILKEKALPPDIRECVQGVYSNVVESHPYIGGYQENYWELGVGFLPIMGKGGLLAVPVVVRPFPAEKPQRWLPLTVGARKEIGEPEAILLIQRALGASLALVVQTSFDPTRYLLHYHLSEYLWEVSPANLPDHSLIISPQTAMKRARYLEGVIVALQIERTRIIRLAG